MADAIEVLHVKEIAMKSRSTAGKIVFIATAVLLISSRNGSTYWRRATAKR